jgi:thiol-disulfide isomerase/thioredoxin
MKIVFITLAVIVVLAVAGLIINARVPQGFTLPMTSSQIRNQQVLPQLGRMPEFVEIESWLNSQPLTSEDLRGKVVLVDFWTYSCINCIRTLPYVTGWYDKYKSQGFVVIGVHTPEFAFEKERGNVAQAIERHQITYPVAQDNNYATWNAYANRYWPAHYLFDAEGNLRYTHFGEGKYDTTEANIQLLLAEAGQEVGSSAAAKADEGPDFKKINTPETYLGYARSSLLGSQEFIAPNVRKTYSTPEEVVLNKYYLAGDWLVESERAVAVEGAYITYRYSAAAVNLVMSPPSGGPGLIKVSLDGKPVPEDLRGTDLFEQAGATWAKVESERLYFLIDSDSNYGEHVLLIEFVTGGTSAYAFTFG